MQLHVLPCAQTIFQNVMDINLLQAPEFAKLSLKLVLWREMILMALNAQSENKILSKLSHNTLEDAVESIQLLSPMKIKLSMKISKPLMSAKLYVLKHASLMLVLARLSNIKQTPMIVSHSLRLRD